MYAACFIRKREIIFERSLLSRPAMFRLILIHELFHFVWPRLGNVARVEFHQLLAGEWQRRARGELGESAAVKKQGVSDGASQGHGRRWREYVCESFCDTAAWLYAGEEDQPVYTLGKQWREQRRSWFQRFINDGCKC